MNTLITQYMPLANKLANEKKKNLPKFISFEELQSAAYLGLVEAANRFDESLGNAFSTFAYWRIIGEMQDYLREIGWGSRGSLAMQSLDMETESGEMYLKDMVEAIPTKNHEEFLEELTHDLSWRSKDVLKKYYFDNMSLKEIAEIYNVSESRVSQLIGECKKSINEKWTITEAYEMAA